MDRSISHTEMNRLNKIKIKEFNNNDAMEVNIKTNDVNLANALKELNFHQEKTKYTRIIVNNIPPEYKQYIIDQRRLLLSLIFKKIETKTEKIISWEYTNEWNYSILNNKPRTFTLEEPHIYNLEYLSEELLPITKTTSKDVQNHYKAYPSSTNPSVFVNLLEETYHKEIIEKEITIYKQYILIKKSKILKWKE